MLLMHKEFFVSFLSAEKEETRRESLKLSNRHLRKFQVATLSERVTGNVFPIVCSGNNMIQHMCCVMPKNFLIVIFAATFCDFRRKMPPSQKRYVRNLTEALLHCSLAYYFRTYQIDQPSFEVMMVHYFSNVVS